MNPARRVGHALSVAIPDDVVRNCRQPFQSLVTDSARLVIVVCLIAATPTVVVAAEETEADAVHTQAGELEETLQAAVGALKNARFNDSVVLLEDIVAGPPSQVKPTAMYLTATALQNLGREEDSLAMHLRAAAEFESFFEGANSRDAAICYEMASQCLARLGRWKEAEETIKKSMALLEAMGAGTSDCAFV